MAALFMPGTKRIQLPTRRYRTKKRSIDHCFVFILNLRVNINKHNQLRGWTTIPNWTCFILRFSSVVLLLRDLNQSYEAESLLSTLGQFKIHIKIFLQRFNHTVRFVNLNIKNAAESKQEWYLRPPKFSDGRWPWNYGCACLSYYRKKKFFAFKTGASRLMGGKEIFVNKLAP